MRAYHRVDPLMDERKSHYLPGELGAFVKIQLLAGRQKHRGRFRSVAALRGALPSAYVRFLQFLIDEGDLVVQKDGSVYVDGWDEWQEGDLTVKDRMAALRARGRASAPYPDRQGLSKERKSGAERTAEWRLRTQVFERDNFTCRYCGVTDYPRGWLVADHVVPEPDGPTTLENLVTACRPCNSRKGGRTPDEAGMPLRDVTRHRGASRDVSRDNASSVGVSVGISGANAPDALPHIDEAAQRFLEDLTGRPIAAAGSRQLTEYDRQLESHGQRAVFAAYSKVARSLKSPTARQVVWSALRILEPFVTPQDIKRLEANERDDEERQAFQRRLEATRRRIAETGGDAA